MSHRDAHPGGHQQGATESEGPLWALGGPHSRIGGSSLWGRTHQMCPRDAESPSPDSDQGACEKPRWSLLAGQAPAPSLSQPALRDRLSACPATRPTAVPPTGNLRDHLRDSPHHPALLPGVCLASVLSEPEAQLSRASVSPLVTRSVPPVQDSVRQMSISI